jgi:hypothetical protein
LLCLKICFINDYDTDPFGFFCLRHMYYITCRVMMTNTASLDASTIVCFQTS